MLFPFAFHCTGMPIQAASYKLRREIESGNIRNKPQEAPVEEKKDPKAKKPAPPKPTWYEILESMGIPEDEIPRF